jgi:hypothetical protein
MWSVRLNAQHCFLSKALQLWGDYVCRQEMRGCRIHVKER